MQARGGVEGSAGPQSLTSASGLLGDTAARDYSGKLRLFTEFAARELGLAIASLELRPGMRVLDAGCGSGGVLRWLDEAVGPGGMAVGIDPSAALARAARAALPARAAVLQADLLRACILPGTFDLIWTLNTVNHVRDPVMGLEALAQLSRPGGRIALAQSALLPEMYFAWDSRLERLTREALRRHYQARYALDERDLGGVRNIIGWMQRAGLRNITVRTLVIERVSPLGKADEDYLLEAIFRATFGMRLRPYLAAQDYQSLVALCDPQHPDFALRRPDFHFLQTLTLASGETPS